MPRQDCKYWDKCYQRNEEHLKKYNHPKKEATNSRDSHGREQEDAAPKHASKHKSESSMGELEQECRSGECSGVDANGTEEDAKFSTDELRKEVLNNIAGKNYLEILQKRIKVSVQAEYDDLLRSNEFIRHKFLVEMPPDFYAFWKFACSLVKDKKIGGELGDTKSGENVLQYMEQQFQLLLVGPFEFLAGRFHNATMREPGDYLRHWRFFYDPPEFQTVFVHCGTGIHYGFWRDTPQEKDGLMIARNDTSKGCEFDFVAGNTFDAFLYYLEKDFKATPFTAATVSSTRKSLIVFTEANEIHLDKLEALRKARNTKVVAKTFHRAGIVVPLETKTRLGYRPLTVSDSELKNILKLFEKASSGESADDSLKTAVMEKLQPVATAASIALDECDFGTSLELGIDLFCSGHYELHMLIQSLLVPAYSLLHRPQYIAISKAHLEKRSKATNLSIFELDKKN